MYEKFYNLKKEPFHITPDPRFLYLSERHKQALASIMYGIEKRKGFVAITGGVGVGKTTVIRAYLEKATNAGLKMIYVFHANVSFKDLVKTIYRELGLELAATDLIEMVDGLHLALIELYRQGKTVVVIIDEAQNMPIETLENLRMLSNLETPTEKLIQVVLVGQTELEELLEKHELRQLKQRIAIRSRIAPLSAQESYAYIEHRLSVAGLDKPTIFSKGALDIIVKEANGVPRLLNILCDNALITGFGYEKNPVTASIAKEVAADFGTRQKRPRTRNRKVPALAVLVAFLALLVAFFLSPYRSGVVQMLGDAGLGHTEKREPVRAPVSRPPGEQQLGVPDREVPPPSEPQGTMEPPGAAEPKTAIKPESAIQPKDIAGQKRGVAAASYKTRVVKQGETLSDLIRKVYRISPKSALEPSLIDLVKQHNPAITDSNLIFADSVIRFPELPKEK
jgi:general secretion pathway protein A